MKCYREYDGKIPSGIEIIKEGNLTRIYFDFNIESDNIGDKEEKIISCCNVDIEGTLIYEKVVNTIICERYSTDKVQAILANYNEAKESDSDISEHKRKEYKIEYANFQTWRHKAKEIAKNVLSNI